jgi:hypothetical protein
MMRASQVSAARREVATNTAAAAATAAAADHGSAAGGDVLGAPPQLAGATGSLASTPAAADGTAANETGGNSAAAAAAAQSDEAEAMAIDEEPDILAQALKDSLHVASNQGMQSETPEGFGLPNVSVMGDGLLQLAQEEPQHVFLLSPLLQQASEGSPDDMLEWASSKIRTFFPSKVCSLLFLALGLMIS